MSDTDGKIKKFKDNFGEIQRAFNDRATLTIEIVAFRTQDTIQNIGDCCSIRVFQRIIIIQSMSSQ